MLKLLSYVGQHKVAVFFGIAFAICSVIFNIVGPKVLGQVTCPSSTRDLSPR